MYNKFIVYKVLLFTNKTIFVNNIIVYNNIVNNIIVNNNCLLLLFTKIHINFSATFMKMFIKKLS